MRVPPPAPSLATKRARALRRNATPAETLLWRAMRARSLDGIRVKRQVPFGPYILDFAIPALSVAIEVDGETHATGDGPARDARRDEWMRVQGWRVLRFTNPEVLGNLEGVLLTILSALHRGPHPGPLPQAGEGEE